MLVKIADNVSINMTSIDSVLVRGVDVTETTSNGWFTTPTKKTEKHFHVEITYRDADRNQQVFKYQVIHGTDNEKYKDAIKVQNNVLSQVKELENVGATQLLEEALRNG
jgi:hypothetical protein